MCHSVEMYLPRIACDAVEHRLAQADFAAAGRERAVVDAGLGLLARLGKLFLRPVGVAIRKQVTDG